MSHAENLITKSTKTLTELTVLKMFFLSTLYLFSTASFGNLFEGMNIPSLSSLNRSRLCGKTKQALRWRLCSGTTRRPLIA